MENFVSTNVSKEKREQLVAKIKAIKSYIASAPQDENTARLLAYIADIEKDIKGKKYGLVFEEHREKIDEILEQNTPVLTEEKDLFIDNGGQMNFLIEGDNLAALQLLEKTHKGKIDLIYIDPPYNTGNKDFIYDDNFVDANDTFRHSKWLSFMQKRLEIAKRLLSENGVIFISIDDNEQSALKMMCDDIFGENNFIANFKWNRTAKAPSLSKKVRTKYEYILTYKAFNNDIELYGKQSYNTEAPLLNTINKRTQITFPASSIITDKDFEEGAYSEKYQVELVSPIISKNGENRDEVIIKGKFKWTQDTINSYLRSGLKFIIKKSPATIYYQMQPDASYIPPSDIINDEECAVKRNTEANKEVQDVGISFNYAKPVSLIYYLIKISMRKQNDGFILDFFAGSGTTGHAVMKLNAEDGGRRKFILCTNNENNICRDVTYERIKRVIERDKYEASLKYYKVDFVPISDRLYYEYADELLKHIRELVELENGINFNGNAEIAIVLTEKELDEFAANMPEKCKAIYLGHDVLPSEAQESLFKARGIAVNIIPDYYYRELEG